MAKLADRHIIKFVDIEKVGEAYLFRFIDRRGMKQPIPKNVGPYNEPQIIHEKYHSRNLTTGGSLIRLEIAYEEQNE